MTSEPRAFLALDLGTATSSVALLGSVGGRWRLVGSRAAPSTIPVEPLVTRLVSRLIADDTDLMASIGLAEPAAADDLVRLVARSRPAPRLAVLAGSDRTLHGLLSAADRAGWRSVGMSAERADSLEMTQLVLDHGVGTVLLGADDPPGADERARLTELGQLLAAAAWRRPELRIVLAGGAREQAETIGPGFVPALAPGGTPGPANGSEAGQAAGATVSDRAPTNPDESNGNATDESLFDRAEPGAADGTGVPRGTERSIDAADSNGHAGAPDGSGDTFDGEGRVDPAVGVDTLVDARPLPGSVDDGRRIVAPAPFDATGGDALRDLLEELRAEPDDARLATTRAVRTLADVLELGIELVEIGHAAGQHVVAAPVGEGDGTRVRVRTATVADAALVPPDATDDHVDEVLAWSTTSLDRYRLRDRLRELRLAPWSDAAGEGALVRAAAAKAAIRRLLAVSGSMDGRRRATPPDLLVAAGGAWATIPGPAVTLALADLVRRPGVCQCALDSGRLLGPLGTIEDERDRIRILRDVAPDLLVPLGSVVMPQGVHPGRAVGHLTVRDADRTSDADLVAGGLQLIDLPPGRRATLELAFRDPVNLGTRGREFEVDVVGGLSGLVVDLRDVPLRLPDRAERRRELLAAWQRALWAGLE